MAIGFRPQGLAGLMMPQPQVPNLQMPMPAPVPAPEAPRDRSGLWRIIGAIGDGLQVAGGGQATFGPAMMQMRDQQAQEQAFREKLKAEAEQRRQEREARMADAIALKEWERANPGQTADMRNLEWYKSLPESDRAVYDRLKPFVVNGPDGPYIVPRSAGPTASQGVTTLPPGYDPSEWEPVAGGPQASPAGGFRPGY